METYGPPRRGERSSSGLRDFELSSLPRSTRSCSTAATATGFRGACGRSSRRRPSAPQRLVSALAIIGGTRRARHLMERLLKAASPLGLYAEEFDAETGRHLGYFPAGLLARRTLASLAVSERGKRDARDLMPRQVRAYALGGSVRPHRVRRPAGGRLHQREAGEDKRPQSPVGSRLLAGRSLTSLSLCETGSTLRTRGASVACASKWEHCSVCGVCPLRPFGAHARRLRRSGSVQVMIAPTEGRA
jgi:hypothetical protein